MLTITINSTPLILPDDLTIRVEINAPYFDTEAVAVSVVWHFDVPIDGNEEAFGYVHLLPVRDKNKKYSVQMQLNGYSIGRGTLICTNITAKVYRVMVTLTTFGKLIEGITVNKASFNPEIIGGTPHSQYNVIGHMVAVNMEGIDRPYRFPMLYAPNFYGEPNSDTGIPELNPDYMFFANHYTSNGGVVLNTQGSGSKNTIVPMPLFVRVMQQIIADVGYTLTGSAAQHPDLAKLLMFSNVTLDRFTNLTKSMAWMNQDQTILPSDGYANLAFNSSTSNWGEESENNLIVDSRYVAASAGNYKIQIDAFAYILQYLGARAIIGVFVNGVMVFEDLFSHTHIIDNTLYYRCEKIWFLDLIEGDVIEIKAKARAYSNTTQDWTIVTSGYFLSYIYTKSYSGPTFLEITKIDGDGENYHANTLDLKKHIPEVLATDAINTFRNLFFSAVFIDEDHRIVELDFLENVLSSTGYVDVTRHIIPTESELEINLTCNYLMKYVDGEKGNDISPEKIVGGYNFMADLPVFNRKTYALLSVPNSIAVFDRKSESELPSWDYYSHNFKAYGQEDENSKTPTIQAALVPSRDIEGKIYPYTSQTAISNLNPDIEKTDLQLLLWRGMKNNRPVAIATTQIEAFENVGELSLDLNAINGVVATFGTKWLNFLAGHELVTERLTNVDEWLMAELLGLLKPNSPKRWLMIHSVKCLPKQMTFIMNVRGDITECEIVAVKSNAL